MVKKDGSAVRAKGVTEVKKIANGEYRITVDTDIRLDRTVPVATLNRSANWRDKDDLQKSIFAELVMLALSAHGR